MSTIEELVSKEYEFGFVSNIESETAPRGLTEDTIHFISQKKTNRNGCWNID